MVKDASRKPNFRPSKKLGQHFISDRGILNRIVRAAELAEEDTVLEIGSGTGSLTGALASRCRRVIAVEIDRRLCEALKEAVASYSNVGVVEGDILKIDLRELGVLDRKLKVVGNLPYYITTPIIMKLIREREQIEDMTLTVQREVAERLSAAPGGKDYGALSVAVQFYCSPSISFVIPRSFFHPRPEVDSAVVRLRVREHPAVEVSDERVFFRTVRASFGRRRKMLLNALSAGLGLRREETEALLRDAGVEPTRRGETLGLIEFARIAALLSSHHVGEDAQDGEDAVGQPS
jgi:16S rRNA (adenine1518-N6/adenine1519-N6)-dimethyltransferase